MLSQTVEYALRMMVCLAESSPRTTGDIARATQVPAAYLAKIVQALGRAGLVESQRGVGGGVKLAHDPQELSVLEIVNAVDPIRRIQQCPLDLPAHGMQLCPLHKKLDEAHAMVEQAFAATTLAALIDKKGADPRSCRFPGREEVR